MHRNILNSALLSLGAEGARLQCQPDRPSARELPVPTQPHPQVLCPPPLQAQGELQGHF